MPSLKVNLFLNDEQRFSAELSLLEELLSSLSSRGRVRRPDLKPGIAQFVLHTTELGPDEVLEAAEKLSLTGSITCKEIEKERNDDEMAPA